MAGLRVWSFAEFRISILGLSVEGGKVSGFVTWASSGFRASRDNVYFDEPICKKSVCHTSEDFRGTPRGGLAGDLSRGAFANYVMTGFCPGSGCRVCP